MKLARLHQRLLGGVVVVMVLLMLSVGGMGGGGEKKYYVGICASVKDDEKWLDEWLEFHKGVGVEQVYLIDDGSVDGTGEIIEKYVKGNFVTLIKGGVPDGDPRCLLKTARDSAYIAKCYDAAAPHLTWMVLIDSDEYLYPRKGCSIPTYLQRNCNHKTTHIPLSWEMFGGSGFSLQPDGGLRKNFLMSGGGCGVYQDQWGAQCASPVGGNCKECRHTKYIVNTRCMSGAVHCHNHFPERVRLADETCSIGENGCHAWWDDWKNGGGKFSSDCCGMGLGLNHYSPKSEEARRWREKRKMRNGLGNDRSATPGMDKRDLNYYLSPDILRFQVEERETFTERGFRYTPRPSATTTTHHKTPTLTECQQYCTTTLHCSAFTYRPSHATCSIHNGTASAWPPNSLPLIREKVDGYISGVPLRGDLCKL